MKRNPRNYKIKSPLEWFNELYGDRKISRSQLDKEDKGLYQALKRRKLLDQAIPEKRKTRDYTKKSPLEYFREEYGDRKINRTQFQKENPGLYLALREK